jgi:hypothetical protein
MAYKRYRIDERIFRGLFRIKIMVNREDKGEGKGLTGVGLGVALINIA